VRAGAGVAFVCACCACHAQKELPAPPVSSAAASALFVVGHEAGAKYRIASIDLTDARGVQIPPFSADRSTDQVGLILYDQPLDALKIKPVNGRVETVPPGGMGQPLPPPDRLLTLDLTKDSPAWVDVPLARGSTLPPYLKLPLLPGSAPMMMDPCALANSINSATYPLDSEDTLSSVGILGRDTAIAVTRKSCPRNSRSLISFKLQKNA
jgi:hypothetical protein